MSLLFNLFLEKKIKFKKCFYHILNPNKKQKGSIFLIYYKQEMSRRFLSSCDHTFSIKHHLLSNFLISIKENANLYLSIFNINKI